MGGLTAGGLELGFPRVDQHRAATGGSRAARSQRAGAAAAPEPGLTGGVDRHLLPGWAGHHARGQVDGEVIFGEPALDAGVGADGLDGLVVVGRSQRGPDLPTAVGRIAKHLQPRQLLGQQCDPDYWGTPLWCGEGRRPGRGCCRRSLWRPGFSWPSHVFAVGVVRGPETRDRPSQLFRFG
jgi:hypothetical protein